MGWSQEPKRDLLLIISFPNPATSSPEALQGQSSFVRVPYTCKRNSGSIDASPGRARATVLTGEEDARQMPTLCQCYRTSAADDMGRRLVQAGVQR